MQLQNLLILVVSACNLVSARSIQGLEKRNPGDGSLFSKKDPAFQNEMMIS